jgi:hypothetical protein
MLVFTFGSRHRELARVQGRVTPPYRFDRVGSLKFQVLSGIRDNCWLRRAALDS